MNNEEIRQVLGGFARLGLDGEIYDYAGLYSGKHRFFGVSDSKVIELSDRQLTGEYCTCIPSCGEKRPEPARSKQGKLSHEAQIAADETEAGIARRAKKIRAAKGMTTRIAGEKAGLHPTTISLLEQKGKMNAGRLKLLADAYGVPIGRFFEDADEATAPKKKKIDVCRKCFQKSCAFYCEGGECTAYDIDDEPFKCGAYKTRAQHLEDTLKAFDRIASIKPEIVRDSIISKYYGNKENFYSLKARAKEELAREREIQNAI